MSHSDQQAPHASCDKNMVKGKGSGSCQQIPSPAKNSELSKLSLAGYFADTSFDSTQPRVGRKHLTGEPSGQAEWRRSRRHIEVPTAPETRQGRSSVRQLPSGLSGHSSQMDVTEPSTSRIKSAGLSTMLKHQSSQLRNGKKIVDSRNRGASEGGSQMMELIPARASGLRKGVNPHTGELIEKTSRSGTEYTLIDTLGKKIQVRPAMEKLKTAIECPSQSLQFFHVPGHLISGSTFIRGDHPRTVSRKVTTWESLLGDKVQISANRAVSYDVMKTLKRKEDERGVVEDLRNWEREVLEEFDSTYQNLESDIDEEGKSDI
eukprot:GHVQ01023679.1.p1 GENE.GHVQ01023679.1~~GHVQ01023679.1.p1  ORF type:complete len:319 (+),score=28.68 GHVQ01023679.1:1571-2527(+)